MTKNRRALKIEVTKIIFKLPELLFCEKDRIKPLEMKNNFKQYPHESEYTKAKNDSQNCITGGYCYESEVLFGGVHFSYVSAL